jgi:pantoate--beta-alanine ligase
MKLAKTVSELRSFLAEKRAAGMSIGMVPTMGALHAGHRSLMERARRECGVVVVSIFVNPTQFGPNEDFARYPRPLDKDLELCRGVGVDVAFVPEAQEVYPAGFTTWVDVIGPLSSTLEGAVRPGHFRGVATVVLKLLLMALPEVAYFGQKDAQQACLVRRVVRDLDVPTAICVCPTVREADGLALSSRNVYLSQAQRRQAPVLHQALEAARAAAASGLTRTERLKDLVKERLAAASEARLDYAEIVDPDTFLPVADVERDALLVLAVRFGSTRLLDNAFLAPPSAATH